MSIRSSIAASAIVAALGLPVSSAAAEDALTASVDALYDLRDQLQDTVMKSVKGVSDAMNDGGPRPPPPGESAINYQLRMHDRLDNLYSLNDNIFRAQQQLLNADARLLQKLPAHDPRRQQITKELGELGAQQSASRSSRDDYFKRRQAFNELIQDYKKRTGSYPPHDCNAAPGWHLPAGVKCDGTSIDPHAGSTGHGP